MNKSKKAMMYLSMTIMTIAASQKLSPGYGMEKEQETNSIKETDTKRVCVRSLASGEKLIPSFKGETWGSFEKRAAEAFGVEGNLSYYPPSDNERLRFHPSNYIYTQEFFYAFDKSSVLIFTPTGNSTLPLLSPEECW